ncbi:hypothetical protein IC765_19660 (plasmid) [Acinetobacter seifertii]|nr:hypothetical protein IC765_06390 [Acinetobacter seifertii]QNY19017.1 hypothetical protein IC765_19660 [Acinetobacter seifertii]
MSTSYPRALYKGDQKNNEYSIAHSEDHEMKLREEGFMHFLDLPEPDPKESEIEIIGKIDSSEVLEQVQSELLKALEDNRDLEEQLATAKGEYISQINDLKLEKQKLEDELKALPASTGVPQEVYDAVYQEREQLLKENAQYKYSAMSAAELRAVLDGKGIKYGSRDEKPALVNLVLESLYPKEGE